MSEETNELRLTALEDFRREQCALNKSIADSLNRIELALSTSIAKACPLPGHCRVLEHEIKAKWEGDKIRFERLEKRAQENDEWHHEVEVKIDAIKTLLNRGLGSIALLVVCMPLLTWFIIHFLVNK
jgi:hypothetical protein